MSAMINAFKKLKRKSQLFSSPPVPEYGNLLLLVKSSMNQSIETLNILKRYFGEQNILKASCDGTVFYLSISEQHKGTFLKKVKSSNKKKSKQRKEEKEKRKKDKEEKKNKNKNKKKY